MSRVSIQVSTQLYAYVKLVLSKGAYSSGYCFGTIVEVTETSTLAECSDQCRGFDSCKWFTYQVNLGVCQLTSDCQFVDENPQEESVYGPRDCEVAGNDGETAMVVFSIL